MHRFFVPKDQIPIITGTDVHHIRNVLRMKVGNQLELLDGIGNIYQARISKIESTKITCEILSTYHAETEPPVKITLAQALPKGQKMDFVVEKSIELGVFKIIPMLTERTVVKSAKLERWRKIAKSAAEQSGRAIIPEICTLTKFQEILKLKNQFDLALIPWELEKENTLKKILVNKQTNKLTNLLILIGPEGGFAQREIEQAKLAGFITVSLGKRILRTETAGMAILSMILYQLE